MLGHQRHERLADAAQACRCSAPLNRSGGLSRIAPSIAGSQPVHERQVGAEGPAEQPPVRQVVELGELDGRRHVEPLGAGLVEGALGWCRAGDVVPRVLKRSTAMSARAGSR